MREERIGEAAEKGAPATLDQLEHIARASRGTNWFARAGIMSEEFAQTLFIDRRLSTLSPRAKGVFLLLHAYASAGMPVLAGTDRASRTLGVAPGTWVKLRALFESTQPPLIMEREGVLLPSPLLRRHPATARRRSNTVAEPAARAISEVLKAPAPRPPQAPSAPIPTIIAPDVPTAAAESTQALPEPVAAASDKPKLARGRARKPAGSVKPLIAPSASPQGSLPFDDMERDPAPVPPCPYEALRELWNKHCTPHLSALTNVEMWPETRRKTVKLRWIEYPDLAWWQSLFIKISASDRLCGRMDGSNWRATFDWVTQPRNLIKIQEDNYVNRGESRRTLFNQGDRPADPSQTSGVNVSPDAPWLKGKIIPSVTVPARGVPSGGNK
jgi:hypothetical protein